MAFGSNITSTEAGPLIPEEVSDAIIRDAVDTGWIFRLARRLPNMSRNQQRLPVLATLPTASFVDGGEGGLIETSEVSWENRFVDAAKIAVIVPVTQEVLDDADYPIWDQVQPLIVEGVNVTVARGVLYGTNIPASWETNLGSANGIVGQATAAGNTVSVANHADFYEAVLGETAAGQADGLHAELEDDGFIVSGQVAHPNVRARIRNTRSTDGFPLLDSEGNIGGAPVEYPVDGSIVAATSLMVAGDWSKLVYSWRRDMRFEMLKEGILQDAAGNITINLAQQDMVAIRIVARLGFALPNPINRMEPTRADRSPFAVLTA